MAALPRSLERFVVLLFAWATGTCMSAANDSLPLRDDCPSRHWPKIDVFVPLHVSLQPHLQAKTGRERDRNSEFVEFNLRTYLLFWPYERAGTVMRVVIDEEKQNSSHVLALKSAVLAKIPSPQSVQFSYIAESIYYNNNGGYRQQYAMFWADNYTSPDAEFVAFADGDTAFTTCIDREDLFEDGRPVVNGRFGVESRLPWRAVPMTTHTITGKEEPMRFMAYFPVVIRIKHLALIREHIRKHLGKATFDEAFKSFTGYFSQFNIMLTVLFWTEELRKGYVWYVHDHSPDWDGFQNPKPNNGQWSDRKVFTRAQLQPKPRVAVHARWHDHWAKGALTIYTSQAMFTDFLQRGVCDCPPFPKRQHFCEKWRREGRVSHLSNLTAEGKYVGYNREMHSFEFVDYYEFQNQTDILALHAARLSRLETCNFSIPSWETTLL